MEGSFYYCSGPSASFGRLNIVNDRDLPGQNNVEAKLKLEQLWKCAENYSFVSDDLRNRCQQGATRNDLARMLQYYSHGMRRALNGLRNNAATRDMRLNLSNCLDAIDADLIATGIILPAFPVAGQQFQIPNGEYFPRCNDISISLQDIHYHFKRFLRTISPHFTVFKDAPRYLNCSLRFAVALFWSFCDTQRYSKCNV